MNQTPPAKNSSVMTTCITIKPRRSGVTHERLPLNWTESKKAAANPILLRATRYSRMASTDTMPATTKAFLFLLWFCTAFSGMPVSACSPKADRAHNPNSMRKTYRAPEPAFITGSAVSHENTGIPYAIPNPNNIMTQKGNNLL